MMLLLIIETDKSCIMYVCTCSIDSCINRADTIIINQTHSENSNTGIRISTNHFNMNMAFLRKEICEIMHPIKNSLFFLYQVLNDRYCGATQCIYEEI